MIDFHTHPVLIREIVEAYPEQLKATREVFNIGNNLQPVETFLLQMDVAGIEKSVLLPLDCTARLGCRISTNEIIAELCEKHGRFIGFASVDPNDRKAPEQLEKSITALGLKGLKLSPAAQGFDPCDRKLAFPLYAKAQQLGIPVLFHAGMSWEPQTKLMPGHPGRFEDIAIDFPNLNIVIAHLKSVLTGISAMFPIQDGKLVKGSRQTIYFLEFDGPLERTYCVQILGN